MITQEDIDAFKEAQIKREEEKAKNVPIKS